MLRFPELTRQFSLPGGPYFEAFNHYRAHLAANTRALEWCCKIREGRLDAGRFLHTAREFNYSAICPAIENLVGAIDRTTLGRCRLSFFAEVFGLAARVGEGLALGYAQQGSISPDTEELKLYVATSRVREVMPLMGRFFPSGSALLQTASRVMIAATFDAEAHCAPRIYALWRRTELDREDVRAAIGASCSEEEHGLIDRSGAATVSIAFKQTHRDMIYLSAPFSDDALNRFVFERVEAYPMLWNALPELRWIGFSKRGDALRSIETNLYFGISS